MKEMSLDPDIWEPTRIKTLFELQVKPYVLGRDFVPEFFSDEAIVGPCREKGGWADGQTMDDSFKRYSAVRNLGLEIGFKELTKAIQNRQN